MRILLGKSWRRGILLSCLGAVLLVAGLFASRQLLLPPLLEKMINRHLQELGLTVSLRAVSGNLFSTLTLEGVEIAARQPHQLQHATIAQVALQFNLLALRQGSETFLATSTVRLLAPDCLLKPTIGLPSTAAPPLLATPAFALTASLLPQLEVRRGHLRLLGDGYEADLAALSLQTMASRSTPALLPLAFEVEKISLLRPDRPELGASFKGRLAVTPTKVGIDFFQLGDQFLAGRGEVTYPQGRAEPLTANLELSLAGVGNATLAATLHQGRLAATLAGHDLPLTPLAAAAKLAEPELGGTLRGEATVACNLDTFPECTGEIALAVAAGHWRQLTIDELEFQAAVAPTAIRIKHARLRSGEDSFALTETAFPLAPLLAQNYQELFRQSKGNFELTLHHLPQLLAAAGLQLEALPSTPPEHTAQIAGHWQEEVVTIPNGSLRLAAGEVSLTAGRFALPPAAAPLSALTIQGELLVDLPDLALFAPVLALPPLQGKLQATAKVNGPLHHLQGQAQVTASRLAYRGQPVGDLTALGSADRQRLRIESLTLVNSGDTLSGNATIPLTAWQKSQARLSLTVRELATYHGLLPASSALTGGVKLDLNWRGGTWRQPLGEAKLQGQHLAYMGKPVGELQTTLTGAEGILSWSQLSIARGADKAESQGQFRLATQEFNDLVVTGRIADLGSYDQSLFPTGWAPSGPLQFKAQVGGKLTEPRISGQIRGEDLRLHGIKIDQLALTANYSRPRLTIAEARIMAHGSELELSGWLAKGNNDRDGYNAEITTLALRREEHQLQLVEAARLELDGQMRWRVEPLLFQDGQSSLQFFGHGEENHWQLKGMAHNLNSRGWLDLLVGNALAFHGLEANFDLSAATAGPTFACQGQVAELNLEQQHGLAGNFDFNFDPQGFSFRKFSWQTKDGLQVDLNGRLPLNPWAPDPLLPGALALDATVNLPTLQPLQALWPQSYLRAGSFQATTNLSGSWRQPLGHLAFSGKELLLAEPLQTIHPLPLSLAGNLDFEQETIRLQELQAFSAILELRLAGLCTSLPAVDDLLRGRVATMVGNLNLTGKLTVPELAKLEFQIPGMRRFGGRLTSELTIHGPLPAPTLQNHLILTEGFLRPDWELPAFNELKLAATLDWPTLQIQALQGEFGGAPFTIDGAIDCQKIRDPKFALHLLSDNLLIYRQPGLKLRGNADVELTGPLSALTLGGAVAITNSSFTEDVNYINLLLGSHRPKGGLGVELFSIKEKPFREMLFDLKFTAKNPIKVKNNMASGGFRPNVKLLGSGELPILAGDFFLDKTRVTLPTGQFTFESGIMRFPPDEPDRQLLDLTGTAQLLGYDVSVQVHGPYNDSIVTLTSNPSLPEEDLLLLVLTGKAPAQNLGSAVAQKSGMKVALYLGRNMLAKWFGGGSGDSDQSILDRFELAIGRGLTQLGEDTIESQFRLAEGVFRPDDVLFLTADKDIYDAYNAGVKIVFRFP